MGLITEDGQIRHPTLQQPAGRLEDAVVVTLWEHDPLAVRAGPLQQPILKHLRRGHSRDRNRQLRQQITDVDVFVDQRERGVDLALRGGGHTAAR